jgi:hypothetical protein
VDVWWHGLTLIQQRQHAFKDELVSRTETQLTYEIASITQLAIRYDKKRSSATGQDDDAVTDEKKPKKSKDSKPSA